MISLLITHKHMELPLETEGQLDLPKQPPFEVLTPGWAVTLTAQFGVGDPNVIRIFDEWYKQGWELDVRAGDGRGNVGARLDAVCLDGPPVWAADHQVMVRAVAPGGRATLPTNASGPKDHQAGLDVRAGLDAMGAGGNA